MHDHSTVITDTPSRRGMMRALFFLGIMLTGLLLIAIIVQAGTSGAPAARTGPDISMGQAMCNVFVRERLKAPSTATFARGSDDKAVANADGSITAASFVDAQNSFGAMIRTRYLCTVMPEPERKTWRLVSLDILP